MGQLIQLRLLILVFLLSGCAAIELTNGPVATSSDLQESSVAGRTSQVFGLPLETVDAVVDLNKLCEKNQEWRSVQVRSNFWKSLLFFIFHNPQDVKYSCQALRR